MGGRLLSFWEGLFSGSILYIKVPLCTFEWSHNISVWAQCAFHYIISTNQVEFRIPRGKLAVTAVRPPSFPGGTVESCIQVVWVFFFLFVVFYMFGIAFTSSAINFLDTLERRQDPKYASLQQHFGSLDVSILTLYMSMTGGQNWGVYYEALTTVPGGEFTCILFIVYITFAAWQQAECVVWYVWCHFSIMMDHANANALSILIP